LILLPCSSMMPDDHAERSKSIVESDPEIGFSQSILADPIFLKQSKFQKIEIRQSSHYGKILVLDDVIQLTETDACSYNEMLAHIPMMQHTDPKNILIIGGGDGYVLNEVLKHDSVEHVDHVELDEDVVLVCREHFSCGSAFNDSRVRLHIQDGKDFVENAADDHYDVIIQDSSDPFAYDDITGEKHDLPSVVLYSNRHFMEMKRILRKGGILNFQSESFHVPSYLKCIQGWRSQALEIGFTTARYGSIYITSYLGGQIGFLMCQKDTNTGSFDLERVEARFQIMKEKGKLTLYYQPCLQSSCFDLPLWVAKSIYDNKTSKDSV